MLYLDGRLDAAVEAASRAINLISEDAGDQYMVYRSHQTLGNIYQSKDKLEKAAYHFEAALEIASSSNWHDGLFWVHQDLALLFSADGKFDDPQVHVEQAKSRAGDNAYYLAHATESQAIIWRKQRRFDEAKPEALRAADIIIEKLGAAGDLRRCKTILQWIEKEMKPPVDPYSDGEMLETLLLPTPINSVPSDI